MSAHHNRTSMPLVAAMVDEVRAVFGEGVKVIYAQEGSHTLDLRDRRCEIAGVECFGVEQLERLKDYAPAVQPRELKWEA